MARWLGTLGGKRVFDIRYLAAVHTGIFLVFYYALLLLLRKTHLLTRLVVAALAMWAFTDVIYAAYFNSFMSDTVALLTLWLMVVLALHIVSADEAHWAMWAMFAVAALFFITSKAQHGMWAFLPAAFAILANWRRASTARRVFGIGLGFLLLAASFLTFYIFPTNYHAQPLFDLVFMKLVHPQSMRQDLEELGLPEDYSRYAGMSAWSPGSPMGDPRWDEQFYRRVRPHVLKFYVAHPDRVLAIIEYDIGTQAPHLRPPLQANYREEDGYPPFTLTRHFCSWSDLRTKLFLAWPGHIVLWWGLFSLSAGVLLMKACSAKHKQMAGIALGIAILGVGEFCFASLIDALETPRHLLLFHAVTDVSICLTVGAFFEYATPRLWRRFCFRQRQAERVAL
jgi:hypothetical protein